MSANRYKPHLLILSEDEANHDIALGFRGSHHNDSFQQRQIQVEPYGKGWVKACECIEDDYADDMRRVEDRYLVVLIDFDSKNDRMKRAREKIPPDLEHRVFIFGVWTEPEDLREQYGTYERRGDELRKDCPRSPNGIWQHELLKHNHEELNRMGPVIESILFGH